MQVSKESNETEVIVILEARLLYFSSFQDRLLVESEPLTLSLGSPPMKVLGGFTLFSEIKSLSSQSLVILSI